MKPLLDPIEIIYNIVNLVKDKLTNSNIHAHKY